MVQTNFSGPIQTGDEVTPGQARHGTVMATQRVSISAAGPSRAVFLPACNLTDFFVNIESIYTVSGAATVRFGTSADQAKYGSVVVSAVRKFDVTTVSGEAMLNLADGTTVVVDVTVVEASGATVGKGSAYINYMQLEG